MSELPSQGDVASTKCLEAQLSLARREINNLRQQLKSLSFLQQNEHKHVKEQLENWRCQGCRNKQKSQIVDTEGAASNPTTEPLALKYIGTISTNFPEKRGTPRQPSICSDAVSKLTLNRDIFTNPSHALEGLEEFSHVWLLFHFHKNDAHSKAKVSPPRLNGMKTGVFATRSPHRPNPIGLSLVKIVYVTENSIFFSGVDMVDGTPVIDIKPYIPQYDSPLTINSNNRYENDLLVVPSQRREANSGYANTTQSQGASQAVPMELPLNNVRVMDGEENGRRDDILGSAASESAGLGSSLDEFSYSRLSSRIGEREAPDGEEEESNSTTITREPLPSTPSNIRVPSWINQSPVGTLHVIFKERALLQLNQLGSEGEEKKNIITNVLKEDPRSVYLRDRWGSHCYVFRISELYVSCKFNDADQVVNVFRVSQSTENESDD